MLFGLIRREKSNRDDEICARLDRYSSYVYQFLTRPDENTDSPFIQTVQQAADIFADRLSTRLEAARRGQLGGAMKGVNAALEAQAMQDAPEAALADAIEKQFKMKKNSLASTGLQIFIDRFMKNQGNSFPAISSGNGSNQNNFTL